jgi:hypothetical protein
VLKLGHKVLQDGQQILFFDLVDMHRLSPMIEVDIEFKRGLSVKQILGFASENYEIFLALFGPLKQMLSDIDFFCQFA